MAEALFYKRMHGLKQTIYKWNQYNINTTYTYWWHRYNVVNSTTYNWNKYNAVSTTVYQWNKWNVTSQDLYSTSISVPDSKRNRSMGSSTSYIISRGLAKVYDSVIRESDPWTGNNYFKLVGSNDIPSGLTVSQLQAWVGKIESHGASGAGSSNGYCYTFYKLTSFESSEYRFVEYIYQAGTNDCFLETKEYVGTAPSNGLHDGLYYQSVKTGTTQGKGSYVGVVTSTSSSTYPNGGASGSYWYDGRTTTTQWSKGSTSYGTVSSTSSSAYPSNGRSGSYWYVSAGSTTTSSKGSTNYGYVTSSSRYTYPDDGEYNGYWYEYDYSPTSSQSQGSYVGEKFSTDRNAYPENGVSGSYWYVFAGEA